MIDPRLERASGASHTLVVVTNDPKIGAATERVVRLGHGRLLGQMQGSNVAALPYGLN